MPPDFGDSHIGSGLGLSAAYRAVQSWGGDISFDSVAGKGSTFKVRLNQWDGAIEVAAPTEAKPAAMSEPAPARILVAEDEAIVAMVLEDTLSEAGHDADIVADGLEAIELCTARRYDLALLDLGLPGLAGDEVAARLTRADPETVTVVMTGRTLGADDPRTARFDLSVRKPFETHEIHEVIARALELKER